MLELISIVVVIMCFGVSGYCYFLAKKRCGFTEIERQHEVAAHRIVLKLARVYRMSDSKNGLAKAQALRELRAEVLQYSDSIAAIDSQIEENLGDGVISFALKKLKALS